MGFINLGEVFFLHMSTAVNLIFFDFPEDNLLVQDLTNFYAKNSKFKIEKIDDPVAANQFLSATENGILFFKVENSRI